MKKLIAAALAALTLALFTACSNAGQLAYIGDEAARAAALTGAGLSADAVTFLGTELAKRDGVEYYVVSFTSGATPQKATPRPCSLRCVHSSSSACAPDTSRLGMPRREKMTSR